MSRRPRISSAERATLSPRERARRKRIAHDKMALRLETEEIYKLVKRIRLTVADLNRLFDADVWYIKDERSGDVFWPEQWMQQLQPHTEKNPWKYFIVERDHFPTFDQAADRATYDGEAIIWCENVPFECEANSLVCWLQAGMEANLPHIQRQKEKSEMLRKKFQGAENETNDAAKQQAQDEEEENYKAIRLEKLQRVQDRHHERYMNAKRQLDASLESLRNEAIQTTPLIRSRDQDKALWQLNFARKDRANFCLQKMDREQWDSIRLSQPSDGSEPRCLQPTEDGEKDPRSNFEDEISMGGVVFKRFRHGRGRERKARRVARPRDDDVDTQKTYGHDQVLDEADLDEEERAARQGGDRNVYFQYDGNFAYGQRHGEDSTTVTFFYTLLGDHFNGTPVKAHELRYANGDIYSGQLAPVYRHGGHPTTDLWSAYSDGQHDPTYERIRYDNGPIPHGLGIMTFADGSRFEGEFYCGRACGLGKYEGASGEVIEGTFKDGVLEGPGRIDHSGLQEVGNFRNGLLHRKGLKLFKDRYLHDGCFERGELHRFGRFETPKLRYRGWLERNIPWDHGVCEFGESRRIYSRTLHGTVELPQYICEGRWCGGMPVGRQSCIQERLFFSPRHQEEGRNDDPSKSRKKKDRRARLHTKYIDDGMVTGRAAKLKAEKEEKRKARDANRPPAPAVIQFTFQCAEAKELARRLDREGRRAAKCNAVLRSRKFDVRKQHNKKVRSKKHDEFLRAVSKVLLADEFDEYYGEKQPGADEIESDDEDAIEDAGGKISSDVPPLKLPKSTDGKHEDEDNSTSVNSGQDSNKGNKRIENHNPNEDTNTAKDDPDVAGYDW